MAQPHKLIRPRPDRHRHRNRSVPRSLRRSLIASLLFGTTPTDPLTFLGMVLVLGSIALLAGYLPARRASRINPMVALRNN